MKINTIQHLRGIAIILVLFAHYPIGLFNFFQGAIGVDIFFIISGYIMRHTAHRHFSSFSYLLKRTIRLYPTYLFITIFTALAYLIFYPEYFNNNLINSLFASIIFQYDFVDTYTEPIIFAGWFLKYEMIFYLMFAIFIKRIKLLKALLFLTGTIGLFLSFNSVNIDILFTPFNLYFLAGILLYENEEKISLFINNRFILVLSIFLLFCVMLGEDQGYSFIGNAKEYVRFNNILIPRALVWGIPSFFLVACWMRFVYHKLNLLTFVGTISYSLYLVHASLKPFIISNAVRELTALDDVYLKLIAILLSFVLSYLIFIVIEQRFSNYLKNKLSNS